MRMEQYLTHNDYALWEVIVNGDAPAIASASVSTEGLIPPKTAEQKLARKNELKAKSTLLLAIPDEHLLKFHGIKDAKTLWEAIKASLPSAWNNIALIMRNKSDLDTLSMDDLYNNLKVYEFEIKGQSSSSSNSQNVAFVSSENPSSTNEAVNTAHDVTTTSSQGQASSLTYVDDVIDGSQMAGGHTYHEGEKILKEDRKESKFQWQRTVRFDKQSQMNESEVVHSMFNSRESDVDDSLVNDRFKTGEGFHAVPPPYIGNYMPSRPDLSFAGLDDSPKTKLSETETKILNYKDIVENVFRPKSDQTKPKFTRINFVKSDDNVKSVNKENTHRKVEYPRKSQSPRDNRRNWNGLITKKLGNAVVTKSGQVPVNTAKQSSPRAAASISTARVNNVTTAGPKAVVGDAKGNGGNVVKSSACWIWRPTGNVIDHTSKDSGSYMRKRFDYVDLQGKFNGCSRHMTKNKSFLTDYQEIDGGFVAFGGSPKGGKITRKGKIKTGKLDFKDVYFVKELKFNLFSVSQMCDKNNNVLFTKTERLVLSPDFKLLDESQVLLKVPRHNNMYSFDLKNDYNRFSWVFFLATKDETSGILKTFITGIENQINHKVKIIRCDNGTEFKNNDMNQFCEMKGIKREFSVARTPQQNEVVERKNRTLIEAARTMLADSLLPTTFWDEAVSTAPSISFMRPFGCPVTILNTLDSLGKFDGKADEGFFVGYSINSKAFMVFNTRTRKVEENLHITFLENKPNVAGSRPDWLFDIDLLTNFMNYEPSSEDAVADDAGKKSNKEPANEGERNGQEKEGGASNKEDDQNVQDFRAELDNLLVQQKKGYANSTNRDSTVSPSVSIAGQNFTNVDDLPTDPLMPDLEDTDVTSRQGGNARRKQEWISSQHMVSI
ncbi:ribonuclease H-like domain-containing protein [Tanacetum coccineum]